MTTYLGSAVDSTSIALWEKIDNIVPRLVLAGAVMASNGQFSQAAISPLMAETGWSSADQTTALAVLTAVGWLTA